MSCGMNRRRRALQAVGVAPGAAPRPAPALGAEAGLASRHKTQKRGFKVWRKKTLTGGVRLPYDALQVSTHRCAAGFFL